MNVAFPYQIDDQGLTARATAQEHVRQLVEQVLLTATGERVNRPSFGCGLARLVFTAPRSETLTALKAMVQAELQQNLSDVVRIQAVDVKTDESQLDVTVAYIDLADQARYTLRIRP